MPLLSIRSLHKSFRVGSRSTVQRREALRGVDLDVERGEILGVVGDKGCGKTTLLRCAAGLLRCDSGTIRLEGCHYNGGSAQLHLLYVHAVPTYYPFLTVRDVLARHVRRESTRLACARAIDRVAHRLSLGNLLSTAVSSLTVAELKRLAIAEATLDAPKVVLFDGTLDGLDDVSLVVKRAIEDLTAAGATPIAASRNAAVPGRIASRILVMEAGIVAASFAAESRADDLAARSIRFAEPGARIRQIAERMH